MIYLDSAATSFYKPKEVVRAVTEAFSTIGNCSRGTSEAALNAARMIFDTRCLLNDLFHGDGAEQTAFTMNITESLNIVIKGILEPGDVVVTSVLEHNSVLRPLYEMEEKGVIVRRIGCTGDRKTGILDEEALLAEISPGVKAVILTHASNLTGNLTNIRRIGQKCQENGVLFVVDAAQTAGVFPIDMQKDGIDILCFTGHKGLLGPQGTGGICIRKGISVKPLVTGGSGILTYSRKHPDVMPTALEAGTLNGHGIAGLRAALLYLKEQGVDTLREKELELAAIFYEQVRDIPGVTVYGDMANDAIRNGGHAAIVTLNIWNEDSGEISDWLSEEYGIQTRSGGHCAPLMHEALGTMERGAVRFSFSHFNTREDVQIAIRAVREIADEAKEAK
ncbi:MAG: aminotransferase class V-fold PLP-dependent enzyme [bacterium]|nr:aminotransferase class V-fold PLP-dependent enzyme [bacterium]